MAERIQVELVDDIDGSPAQQTVTFALDGVTYEIDLTERHARDLRALFDPYIQRSRSPEQERAPRNTKQQERAERENRQANRQLTEQIRGAAQRTRDRLNQKQDEAPAEDPAPEAESAPHSSAGESPHVASEGSQPVQNRTAPDAAGANTAVEQESGQHESAENESRAASVSLPQFSSAVD